MQVRNCIKQTYRVVSNLSNPLLSFIISTRQIKLSNAEIKSSNPPPVPAARLLPPMQRTLASLQVSNIFIRNLRGTVAIKIRKIFRKICGQFRPACTAFGREVACWAARPARCADGRNWKPPIDYNPPDAAFSYAVRAGTPFTGHLAANLSIMRLARGP